MNITPFASEKDLPTNLLEAGTYDFEIMEADDQVSQKGNEMIKLRIAIYVGEKIRTYVFDYLLDSFPAKLRHCCDAVGLLDCYQQGTLEAEKFVGRTGKCRLKIEKDENGNYPDKNAVSDYILRPTKPIVPPAQQQHKIGSDGLPF